MLECTLNKFADSPELGGSVDALQGNAVIERHLL